ncbi:Coenzyme F420 hydrogenase/dehydrogenase, beta subunit C-terminal domain [Dyadobacter sp. LJ53]|uniref:Coenzyme F420 hydrogenase/dehydrogenase, beta subunit C-terminal domain n=1 Tax=Dyadobacter chenwenxiniae TaxID=2906456 RepID=UPI001F23491F|nr:Coenzyme F420 hydrogenase/dehydrogenase, beta subunit C-terminal domain [Dyadobacter chenwenxiniae]MCF0048439.1 Coenzyme F420 hydrogenase/dehydrogenase, beta subunit C-terminal domain [Dyadobacter chenwenxiniae]
MAELVSKPSLNPSIDNLFNTVVKGGYCVGCGACAALEQSPIVMKLDEYSMFKATIDPKSNLNCLEVDVQKVCPFSNFSDNEDVIGQELFESSGAVYHEKLGYHLSTFAGYVAEGEFRKKGSSGGMGTWLVSNLLKNDHVDSVIHVHQRVPTEDDKRLFHYQISTSQEEVASSSKSRYYPIELSEMITLMRNRPGRYAIVGIPCFIKAVRLLSKEDKVIRDRVKFCVGLICGHLKSTRYAEMFSWQCKIPPSALTAIDFRTKLAGHGANEYGITAIGNINGQQITKVSPPIGKMYGTNWGFGFFKYKACDYCDDVVAETADVTIGDAWLPQYVTDTQGTNVIIVRNPVIQRMIDDAREKNNLILDDISASEVVKSQSSGFAHRREGLAYRLGRADQKENWRPIKRVQPSNNNGEIDLKQEYRIEMAELSHIAFNKAIGDNNFKTFKAVMQPVVKKYTLLYRKPFWTRVINKLIQIKNKFIK